MNHLFSSFAVFFYISAVGSALITKNLKIWGSLILMGIVSALYAGHLTMMALPILFLIFGITYFYYRAKTNFSKIIAGLAFIVVGAITLLNKVPGVHNWKIIDDVLLTSDAIPLNLYFGFDSGIIGLSVIAFGISTICSKTELKNMLKKLIFLIPLMLIVVISFSIVFGYVKWDPKWTPLVFIWSLSNLFFTCVIEESIFRHFIQKGLQNSFHKIKYGDYLGVIIASILFGLAHYAGGTLYIFLATIAGLFYGIAYHITGRLEASIVSHYVLNATHFIFFTYPVLATAIS